MDLPSTYVHKVITEAGVKHLHHANSVATACHFLRSGALLSRGTIQRLGLYQTPQDSDKDDRRYSLWFDVFTDGVDIHARASRANAYGPVLFVLNADLLVKRYTGRLWVTKRNPTKWAGLSREGRWFQSKDELKAECSYGTFDQMLVFRHLGGELPFGSFLEKVVLDDPQMKDGKGVDFYSVGYGCLKQAMYEGGIDVPLEKRTCSAACTCASDYQGDTQRTLVMFKPYGD